MSSDLVQKLRDGNTLDIGEAADRIEALEGEVRRVNDLLVDAHQHANKWMKERDKESARAERLREALEKIEQDDYDRTGRHSYDIINGRPTKNDTCDHGRPYWDDCGICRSLFARKALKDDKQ